MKRRECLQDSPPKKERVAFMFSLSTPQSQPSARAGVCSSRWGAGFGHGGQGPAGAEPSCNDNQGPQFGQGAEESGGYLYLSHSFLGSFFPENLREPTRRKKPWFTWTNVVGACQKHVPKGIWCHAGLRYHFWDPSG